VCRVKPQGSGFTGIRAHPSQSLLPGGFAKLQKTFSKIIIIIILNMIPN
jgi:hypothetical protein